MRGLTATLALTLTFVSIAGAGAQERQGQVLPPGQLRLTVGAESFRASSRFGEPGALAPLLESALTPATFSGAAAAADALRAFLVATGGAPTTDPATLSAGNLSAELSSNYRYLPIRLGLGLLPRLEIAVELPIYRTESLFTRLDLVDGNVGLNATPAPVIALLSPLGPRGAALANSPLLPLADSPLGRELAARVLALTGQNLSLPTAPVTYAQLLSRYPASLPASRTLGEWLPGDLEVEGRFELLRSFPDPHFPADSLGDFDYRLTVVAAGRIPTGRTSEEAGFAITPAAGYAGARVGAITDVFIGGSYWVNAGGMLEVLGSSDVIVFDGGGLLSGSDDVTLSRTPGAGLDLWLEPRRRLTRELAVGAVARSELWGEGEDELEGIVIPLEGGSRHSLGASITYSTLVTSEATRGLPLEATAGFTTALAGADGVPRSTVAYFQLSVLRRIWGGVRQP